MIRAELVTKKLIELNKTISFMESCTSGLIASMFTDTEGASAVFKGSFVTYSNEVKVSCGVDLEIIKKYGVYSKECAMDMAKAVKNRFCTDIAVGITGTAGNYDPNNPEGLVGEVFYCIIFDSKIYDYHMSVDVSKMSRKEIKQHYADAVYDSLYELL